MFQFVLAMLDALPYSAARTTLGRRLVKWAVQNYTADPLELAAVMESARAWGSRIGL